MRLKGPDKPYTGYLCFHLLLFRVCNVQADENSMVVSFRMKGNIAGMEVNMEQLLEKVLQKADFFYFHRYLKQTNEVKLIVWSKIYIFDCR